MSTPELLPAIHNWRATRSTERLVRDFSDPDFDDSTWSSIEVPSHWQTQIGFEDYDGTVLYRADLTVPTLQPGQRRWLRFNGLCYSGDVFLDGAYVGETEGYFTHHRLEVTDLISDAGTSVLAVEVGAPKSPAAGEPRRAMTGWFAEPPGAAPTWNPAGIWRSVSIVDTGPCAIRHFRAICTEANEHEAVVLVRAVILAAAADDITVTTQLGTVTLESTFTVATGENQLEWTITIPDPPLWWPHGLGDQPLTDLWVTARSSDGTVTDRKHRQIGFRTTTMRDFIIRINGIRVFAKGVNVGPTERDLARLAPEGFMSELRAIRDAGFNMVRCRSHVSRPEFYDACDQLGLLVWQDMPLIGGFVRSITGQAEKQAREMIDLLGHHPSIAVWGGHYRPHSAAPRSSATPNIRSQQVPSWNRTLLDRSIRRTISGNDSSRPVVANSDVAPHVPQLSGSDLGLYFGWFEGDASELAEYAAALPRFVRFVSDMGAQALPARVEMDLDALLEVFGAEPDTLQTVIPATSFADSASWIDAMRDHQAAVLKTTIEILRVLKYQPAGGFCAGLWKGAGPGLSRALVDYDRTPRPALAAAQTALQTVLPVLYPPTRTIPARTSTSLALYICNDDHRDSTLTARVIIDDHRGETVKAFAGDVRSDDVAYVGDVSIRGGRIGDVCTVTLEVTDENGRIVLNNYTFVAT